jgi:hypothetical protein
MGAHRGGAVAVTVLSRRGNVFPFEVHRLAFEQLSEPAGDFVDFARAELRDRVVVPELAEAGEAAAWSIWRIDDSPAFISIPNPHRAGGTHVYDGSRRRCPASQLMPGSGRPPVATISIELAAGNDVDATAVSMC